MSRCGVVSARAGERAAPGHRARRNLAFKQVGLSVKEFFEKTGPEKLLILLHADYGDQMVSSGGRF